MAEEKGANEETYADIDTVYAVVDLRNGPFLVLTTADGRLMNMYSVSPDVVGRIVMFSSGHREGPSWCRMIDELSGYNGMSLKEIKVYDKALESGDILYRADLFFEQEKSLLGSKKRYTLREHFASESVALALYYDVPIKVKESLLRKPEEEKEEDKATDMSIDGEENETEKDATYNPDMYA